MSSIVKTDAVVLRSMKYRETSRIVTLYTRRRGKISGLVKGARRAGNRFGPSLDPMSVVSVVYYARESREIQTIAQCDLLRLFRRLSEDLEAMAAGMAVVELVSIVAHEEEENDPLFRLLVDCLDALNTSAVPPQTVLLFFQIHLCSIMGFRATFDRCAICGRPMPPEACPPVVRFHLGKGGPACPDCSKGLREDTVSLHGSLLPVLARLAQTREAHDLRGPALDQESREELNGFLWSYLRRHLTGIRTLRSESVFSKILATS